MTLIHRIGYVVPCLKPLIIVLLIGLPTVLGASAVPLKSEYIGYELKAIRTSGGDTWNVYDHCNPSSFS